MLKCRKEERGTSSKAEDEKASEERSVRLRGSSLEREVERK